jgi:hypothetical protein
MNMAQLAGSFPGRRALVGIQTEFIDWSEKCSPPVAARLGEAADQAIAFFERWHAEAQAAA